ncbi:MAG: hypothetical protein ABSA67_01890 [Candidatus Brocadiia bacterium]|jgi:ribosomal protein S21
MELNKFGVILKFALDMEERAAEFYEAAGNAAPSLERKSAGQEARKNIARLQRMRRELVNEMLLEPITGFDYPLPPPPPKPGADPAEIAGHEEALRTFRRNFYRTAAQKIEIVSPAVSQVFNKMADAP